MAEKQYEVTCAVVTPGYYRGEVRPASDFGDLLDAHLAGGFIAPVTEAEAEEAAEPDAKPAKAKAKAQG